MLMYVMVIVMVMNVMVLVVVMVKNVMLMVVGQTKDREKGGQRDGGVW